MQIFGFFKAKKEKQQNSSARPCMKVSEEVIASYAGRLLHILQASIELTDAFSSFLHLLVHINPHQFGVTRFLSLIRKRGFLSFPLG